MNWEEYMAGVYKAAAGSKSLVCPKAQVVVDEGTVQPNNKLHSHE